MPHSAGILVACTSPSFASRPARSGASPPPWRCWWALHGIGAGVLATLGPLHTHAPDRVAAVLDDGRRGPSHVPSTIERAALIYGHSHGDGSAARHHHPAGDPSVALAGDSLQGDSDDGGVGASLGAVLALVPAGIDWLPQAARDVQASRLAWVPRTRPPEPIEKPPRSA